jgi:DNA repair protein RadC|tara:strand:- start:7824 stop:8030 length:207 start_codon:yes stop_codon:yes gene_type:complete
MGKTHEIETAHGEFSPQALRNALMKVDEDSKRFKFVIIGMMGANRVILTTETSRGEKRIEVYMRRQVI